MDRLIVAKVLLLLIGIAGDAGTGLPSHPAPPPATPYVESNVCPFECCQFGDWITVEPIIAYQSASDTSEVAFTTAAGDTILAETGNLVCERFGKVLIRKPIRSFQPRDTVLALRCAGEEGFLIWEKGKFVAIEEFWPIAERGDPQATGMQSGGETSRHFATMIEHPLVIWWVKVRTTTGKTGWLRLENKVTYCFGIDERIEGLDACD